MIACPSPPLVTITAAAESAVTSRPIVTSVSFTRATPAVISRKRNVVLPANVPLPVLFSNIENLLNVRPSDIDVTMPVHSVRDFKAWIETKKPLTFELLRNCILQSTACSIINDDVTYFIINETIVSHLLVFQDTLATVFCIAYKLKKYDMFFDLLEYLLRIREALEVCKTDHDIDNLYSGGASKKYQKLVRNPSTGILYEFIPRSVKCLLKRKESESTQLFLHMDFAINTAITMTCRDSDGLSNFGYILKKYVGKDKYITLEMFSAFMHNTNFYRHVVSYHQSLRTTGFFRLIEHYIPDFFWEDWVGGPLMRVEKSVANILVSLSSSSSSAF